MGILATLIGLGLAFGAKGAIVATVVAIAALVLHVTFNFVQKSWENLRGSNALDKVKLWVNT